ncbi:MAG: hypothetical protein FWE48_04885 [Coriobacteriia bacterium]|nr:hypothetical protein [Coriobacteriia bacterium]
MAIGSLVCGIVGRTKTPVGMKSGMAIAGIVLGSVGIVVGIIAMIIFLIALGDATSSPEFYDLMRQLEAY